MTDLNFSNLNPTLENLTAKYNVESPTQANKANIILVGGLGTGKTTTWTTAPKPIWAHSFDPTGFDSIRHLVDGKTIIADTQFEGDNPKSPTKFALWDQVYHRMKIDGIFNQISTFVLDSATTWGDAIMHYVLKTAGRPGTFPYENDWPQQMVRMYNAVLDMLSLPCNIIFVAHPVIEKDNVTGRTYTTPMLTGKLREKIPLLFSEIYYSITSQDSSGIKYKILTQPDGLYNARTRLGAGGKLLKHEEPNITNILRKVGVVQNEQQQA
jgi:hypothetical protein